MKRALAIAISLLTLVACTPAAPPPAQPPSSTSTSTTPPPINPIAPVTYTVEPFDMDGVAGITLSVTQLQFGGRYCPCEKIPYPADGLHNQQGVDAIASIPFKDGDTLMGFSLGVQVISMFLSQHTLPPGVKVLLAGDTLAQNDKFVAAGVGIPADIANQVVMVANEYDGWSDSPTDTKSPNYWAALWNAGLGTTRLHYYANANPADPANVVTHRGNITAILIPTVTMPNGNEGSRAGIDQAYTRPGSTPVQRAAAASQQVPYPNPPWASKPEPAAAIK